MLTSSVADAAPHPASRRSTLTNAWVFQLVVDHVLPYHATTSHSTTRALRDSASQLSHSPPLSLVAAQPSFRVYCEDELPYRIGGAWWLSHYTCERADSGRAAPADSPPAARTTGQTDSSEDDRDDRAAEDHSDDSDGAGSEDLLAPEKHVMTRSSGRMGLLPRQLSSARLFAYLDGIPTRWVSFCSLSAQSCREEAMNLCRAGAAQTPPTADEPVCMSQLFVMCNHTEGRLAHSLWWCHRRLEAVKRYSRRRQRAIDACERRQRTQSLRGDGSVRDVHALFLCCDLTFLGTVEQAGVAPLSGPPYDPLLSFVFLYGAVTVAVAKEAHKERLEAAAAAVLRDVAPDATAYEPQDSSTDAARTEAASCEDCTGLTSLLDDCDATDDDDGDDGETAAAAAPLLNLRVRHRRAARQARPTVPFERLLSTRLFVTASALAAVHVRVELHHDLAVASAAAVADLRQSYARHSREPRVGDAWEDSHVASLRVCDLSWLAGLFPDARLLDLDGEPSAVDRRAPVSADSGSLEDAAPAALLTVAGMDGFAHLSRLFLRHCCVEKLPASLFTTSPLRGRPCGLRELCVLGGCCRSDAWLLLPPPPTEGLGGNLCVLSFTNASVNGGDVLRALSQLAGCPPRCPRGVTAPPLDRLTHIDLSKTNTDSAALAAAALDETAPHVQALRLSATRVSDVNALVRLRSLRVLNLAGSRVTPDGIVLLQRCRALRELYLMSCPQLFADHRGERTDGVAATPTRNVFSLGQRARIGEAWRVVRDGRPASRAGDDSATRRPRPLLTPRAAAAHRQTFRALRILDLSNNRGLTELSLSPSLTCTLGTGGVAPPAQGWFPRLRRLQLMLTSVADLGPLAFVCPRLCVLDASYTNVVSEGLWTHCVLPARLPRSQPLSLPQPLRLRVLRLSGAPVSSLAAMRHEPPAAHTGELWQLHDAWAGTGAPPAPTVAEDGGVRHGHCEQNAAPRGEHSCPLHGDAPTDALLTLADAAVRPLIRARLCDRGEAAARPVEQRFFRRSTQCRVERPTDGAHDDAAGDPGPHAHAAAAAAATTTTTSAGATSAGANAARAGDEASGSVHLRYGFASVRGVVELALNDTAITGVGVCGAFLAEHYSAVTPATRELAELAALAAAAVPDSARPVDGRLRTLYLRSSPRLVDGSENADGTGDALRGQRDWQSHSRGRVTREEAAVLLAWRSVVAAQRAEEPSPLPPLPSAAPSESGLLVLLAANAPSLQQLDLAATGVSMEMLFRAAEAGRRLTDVFAPLLDEKPSNTADAHADPRALLWIKLLCVPGSVMRPRVQLPRLRLFVCGFTPANNFMVQLALLVRGQYHRVIQAALRLHVWPVELPLTSDARHAAEICSRSASVAVARLNDMLWGPQCCVE